jgi:peptidyl-prolyl cis-trans isomerase SurA
MMVRLAVCFAQVCLVHLLAASIGLLWAVPAPAAQPFAPAVVVNDDLITEFDVEQRMRLMQLMGVRGEKMREQAVESLIDDKLRAQAAKALGVKLDEQQLNAAIDEFARARNMTGKEMMARVVKAGVTRQAMIDLISNQAAFRDAMRLRFLARATPTDNEIEEEKVRGPGVGASVLHLAELVLVIRERGEVGTQALAEQLFKSLSGGADFAAAARKYSRSPTARKGGDIGWLPIERLPPTVVTALAPLAPGEVTRPIPVPNALVILKVLGARTADTAPATLADVAVTVGRLVVALDPKASETDVAAAQVEAERVGKELKTCADVEARKQIFGTGSGTQGPVPLRSLPDAERQAIATLVPGEVSPPVRSKTGMEVILVCARTGKTDVSAIEQVRNRLVNERMVSYATGYLQELRRDAVIEYR